MMIVEPSGITWQGYLIANATAFLGLAFFLGRLTSRVEHLEKSHNEFGQISEAIQRLRSAYHEMAGYMQLHHRDWKPYDLDKE